MQITDVNTKMCWLSGVQFQDADWEAMQATFFNHHCQALTPFACKAGQVKIN